MAFIYAVIILAAVYLIALCPITVSVPRRKKFFTYSKKPFAHRGLHNIKKGIPENSLPAFNAAISNGYSIELDVQLSKDNVPVVFHDTDLNRVCSLNKRVKELTFKELSGCRLFGTEHTIPSLEQVLKIVDGKVPLLIEYKTQDISTDIYKTVDKMLEEYHGEYMIQSFNPFTLLWYRLFNRSVVRGQLSMDFKGQGKGILGFLLSILASNWITSPDFISYHIGSTHKLSFKICRYIYKIPCLGWTVQTNAQRKKAEKIFDQIIFEKPTEE